MKMYEPSNSSKISAFLVLSQAMLLASEQVGEVLL